MHVLRHDRAVSCRPGPLHFDTGGLIIKRGTARWLALSYVLILTRPWPNEHSMSPADPSAGSTLGFSCLLSEPLLLAV